MSEDLLEIGRNFFYSMIGQDWPTVRALITDDIVWTMPGTSRISGTVQGKDAVVERVKRVAAAGVRLPRIELRHMLVGETTVMVFLYNKAVADDGREIDEHLASIYHIRNDKVVAIDTLVTDVDGINAFFI
ncbi:nuclear transport factor 2 family protein [Actinocrispum wychmicini]|uniref:SnoaL-like domain-containing protein n=1 Tax=Actinocrispum wychmicini TaxID=1213861 RepID=A0A4R2J6X4_9PSEU|nr:nuclear transport factor 2 family protein [Actinocrispum wychmicini]TCO52296.1 hypothetical protein EV192_11227 [Actinocrispum wychmicini]